MLAETAPTIKPTLQELRSALIETALRHEQVATFIEYLKALLVEFNRPDVEIDIQTQLSEEGVSVRVSISLETLYPGQASREPERYHALEEAERSLLHSLRSAGVNIGQGGSIGRGDSMKNYFELFDVVVGFDGELSSD